MDTILEAAGICKSYRMGQSVLNVLRGVGLTIARGEFAAIVGASGSGKSTLLHILGALDRPDKGHVKFDGKRLDSLSFSRLNRFRNSSVGFVFQFYHLLDELDVLENVLLPAMASNGPISWLRNRSKARKNAMEILGRFGLAERIGHRPYQLSGGERQRVAIARAMMNRPALLLADEPTGNLDSATGNGILTMFEELNRSGQTILMVTHDQRIAARAGRIITLIDGKIVH